MEFGNCLYEGEFKNDQIEGFGILKLPNLTFYKGKWLPYKSSELSFYTIKGDYAIIKDLHYIRIIKMENNKFDGYGKEYDISNGFNESNYYLGQFKNDLKEGYGIQYSEKITAKIKYEGYFSNNKKNGIGIYVLKNVNNIEGNPLENGIYEGEFRNDEKNGIGIFISGKGYKYEGEFRNDKKNGIGIFISEKGYKYEGEFQNNERNGIGMCILKNGSKFEGEFKNNYNHGYGSFTSKNGFKIKGNLNNNDNIQFIHDLEKTFGIIDLDY